MSDSRTDFIRIMEKKLGDPNLKKTCQVSSQDCLERKKASRAFDHFPNFLPEATFDHYCKKFKTILLEIKSIDQEHEFKLTKKKNMTNITAYIKSLAQLGCKELLDEKGQIKEQIIALFGWEKYKDKMPTHEIVSAFIAAVNMSIAERLSDFIYQQDVAYQAYASFVNQNYLRWVKETMRELGFHLSGDLEEKEIASHSLEIIRLPTKKQAAIMGGVLAGVVAVAWMGLTLFGTLANQKSNGNSGPAPRPSKP
ncbi:MAG: hypothetical protein ACYCQI_00885 [Gammaproteobacteria bacterium]